MENMDENRYGKDTKEAQMKAWGIQLLDLTARQRNDLIADLIADLLHSEISEVARDWMDQLDDPYESPIARADLLLQVLRDSEAEEMRRETAAEFDRLQEFYDDIVRANVSDEAYRWMNGDNKYGVDLIIDVGTALQHWTDTLHNARRVKGGGQVFADGTEMGALMDIAYYNLPMTIDEITDLIELIVNVDPSEVSA
jgi:hypothetical protein